VDPGRLLRRSPACPTSVRALRPAPPRRGADRGQEAHLPNRRLCGKWLDSYFARDFQELFRTGKRQEFLRHARGWQQLRAEDCGGLWEHLVLDTLRAVPVPRIQFWRDKQQREVDFVLPRSRGAVDALECKWSPDAFEPRSLAAFRQGYPGGRNYLLCPGVRHRSVRRVGGLEVTLLPIGDLRAELSPKALRA